MTFLFLAVIAAAFVASGNAQEDVQITRPDRTAFVSPALHANDEDGVQFADSRIQATPILSWSKVAFQSFRFGNWDIFVSNDDGSGPVQLTGSAATEIHPHLNRGATEIIYAQEAGDFEIYKMNADGSNRAPLTSNGADDGRPAWSPDGTKIAFESYRDGQAEIYVMNADGSNKVRLTMHGDFDGMPTWSPDGVQIAFVSRRTGGYRIWVMNADGSGKTQITNQPYSFHPKWSPDGTQIAFDADAEGDGWQELWRINVDGTAAEKVVDPTGSSDAWAGSWSPDGRYIAYTYIRFVYYRGNWYWTNAFLKAWDSHTGDDSHRNVYNTLDWEPRWQTMDDQNPASHVWGLSPITTVRYPSVMWSAQDAGAAGLRGIDVQYRVGSEGAWQDWMLGTTETFSQFPATPGTTVSFRSRAGDNAYNRERWPVRPDATTSFYQWSLSGSITDNRGIPLQKKSVTVHPELLRPVTTDENGAFRGYTVTTSEHTLSIGEPDYDDLAGTTIQPANGADRTFYLPPLDNLTQNGSFEEDEEQPLGWTVEGTIATRFVRGTSVSGESALAMGSVCNHLPDCVVDVEGNTLLGQDLAIAGDKDGNLHALHRVNAYPHTRIFYSVRFTDGTKHGLTIVDESPTAHYGLRLHMAFDSQKTLHAVWLDTEGLKHMYKPEGETWTTPEVVADAEYNLQYYVADIAIAPNDGLHVLYLGSDEPSPENLLYLERLPTGQWQSPREIWSEQVTTPRLAVGPDNSLHVSWQVTYSNDPAGDHLLFYRVRSPEGVWQPRDILFNTYDHTSTEVSDLGFDRQGILHLFWYDGVTSVLRHTMKPPDEPWTSHDNLGPLEGAMAWDVDSRGMIHWTADYRYRQYTHENGWTAPISIEGGGENLDLEIDPKDFFHLVWSDYLYSYQTHPITTTTTTDGFAVVAQQATIPADSAAPTLSFMARARQDLEGDATGLEVLVADGITSTTVFSQTLLNEWQQYWVDLEGWQGETITVSFRLNQRSDDPLMELYLDDISLGSAHPDTWVGVTGPGAAKPGDEVVYEVSYGNRGAVNVYTGTLTVALPPELEFQDASLPPLSTSPLTWNVGETPSQSTGDPLVLTVTVASSAQPLATVLSQFVMEGIPAEIESGNNVQQLKLLIGERLYLPVVSKPY